MEGLILYIFMFHSLQRVFRFHQFSNLLKPDDESFRVKAAVDSWLQSDALFVDYGRTSFLILLLGYPLLLERRQRCQDGTSDPDRILSLWRIDDLHFHRGSSELTDLHLQPVCKSSK